MHPEPLPNLATAEARSQIEEALLRAPQCFYEDSARRVREIGDESVAIEQRLTALNDRARAAVTVLCTRLDTIVALMPVPQTLFRIRVEKETFLQFCHAISEMEREHRAVSDLLLQYAQFGDAVRTCQIRTLKVQGDLYAAKAVARDTEERALCAGLLADLHADERERAELYASMCATRDRIAVFCFKMLPRFFSLLRERADLAHDGENCDGTAVRALCIELRGAARTLF